MCALRFCFFLHSFNTPSAIWYNIGKYFAEFILPYYDGAALLFGIGAVYGEHYYMCMSDLVAPVCVPGSVPGKGRSSRRSRCQKKIDGGGFVPNNMMNFIVYAFPCDDAEERMGDGAAHK